MLRWPRLFQYCRQEELLLRSVYCQYNYYCDEPTMSFTSVHVRQRAQAVSPIDLLTFSSANLRRRYVSVKYKFLL